MTTETAVPRASAWPRFLLVHALQLPALAFLAAVPPGWGWAAAGLWGSLVAAAGTDSGWRWRNRILVGETIVWLTFALCSIP